MRYLKALAVLLLCVASTATAQGRGGRAGGPLGFTGGDALAQYFFTPDLIMAHKEAIGFTGAQEASLRALMLEAQKTFVPVQLKTATEVEKLQKLVKTSPVDEKAVIDEVDRVLALEREVKHAQLTLMVRLKNLLTQQQQDTLAKLRSQN